MFTIDFTLILYSTRVYHLKLQISYLHMNEDINAKKLCIKISMDFTFEYYSFSNMTNIIIIDIYFKPQLEIKCNTKPTGRGW
jgi:hypothetical protein